MTFNETVTLRRSAADAGVSASAATVRCENNLVDENGSRCEIRTFLLPGHPAVFPGGEVVCDGKSYRVKSFRYCRDIGGKEKYLRIETVR